MSDAPDLPAATEPRGAADDASDGAWVTEAFDAPVDAEVAVATPRMGLLALAIDTLRRPSAAMRRLADHPGRRWVWPLGSLALLRLAIVLAQSKASQAYANAATQAAMAQQPGMDPEMAAQAAEMAGRFGVIGVVFGAVGAVVAVLVGALIVAAVLHFVGTVLGGQQGFAQVFTVTSWARLPLIVGALLQLAYALTGGFDPCPRGLSGLVCPDPASPGSASYWSPLLAQIEVWNLWYLLLLGLGVQAVSRVSRRKAVLAVAVVLLLSLSGGLAGTAIARFFAGFGS